ncbi:cytochrome d ubiquinol oxidase subunit II [Trinickia terrae]|uniref:Cytochrome d ubiquinol oxidase subunit II n=1 Tax=Trinickia terrae TaxID=2571161 RepID=A0A4V5PJP4_9BURK|nr:cytochrome d ubiquinol oxidase subunit II [Trinickia terrae]TKC92220.1 cytochrome d ubiquinol oxidase subunit II [Trinickia terrae]
MNPLSAQDMLSQAWFALIGLMLALYVVTDGFDLGVGILTLFRSAASDREPMIQSIGHVWDANETWLVALAGALFGAFPRAYATLLSELYIPVMAMLAGLIMRGAAIEFRHAATTSKTVWERVFGVGSLLAATSQGVILGKVITGLLPGALSLGFVVTSAIGVVSGYALLGATWLVKKTVGRVQTRARHDAIIAVIITILAAVLLSIGTLVASPVADGRWSQPGVFHLLVTLSVIAALAFCSILYSLRAKHDYQPFVASIVMFLASFAGLALSVFPDIVPGRLSIAETASSGPTLVFMMIGIGFAFPIMVGYNLYQYYSFRGKVVPIEH